MPGALSSTLTRAVSTTTRLRISYPPTKGLKFARSPFHLSLLSPQRPYSTVGAASINSKLRSGLRRFLGFTTIATISFFAGFGYYSTKFSHRMMAVPIPTDEESLTAFTPSDDFTQKIEDHIYNHPLAESLRQDPAFAGSRPYMKIPENLRSRSLTAGTLSNSKGIVVPPLVFCNKEASSLVSIIYLGPNVSGHPGIVHGGLLATLLDEGMGRCAFLVLPNQVGVTANLNIDYRRPAMAKNYFVMRAQVVKSEGRKAWVEARIETLPDEGQEPEVLVEAKSLFVEPKEAAALAAMYKFAS
ncbi:HotDog domain-containing protein [Aspergillus cavernicola]|uniref:HotDog domain-containing protein n=1 Tax=Aspergillus cavernicola TaxID=176166 RepID=A0ABR4HU30_9EURO